MSTSDVRWQGPSTSTSLATVSTEDQSAPAVGI